MNTTTPFVLLAAAGLALSLAFGAPAAPGAPAPATTTTAPSAAAAAAPASAALPAAPAPPDRSRQLELPDGNFVPALNGAVDAAPLATFWGQTPWSPIVGVRRGQGVDWYEHADGSFSTTQMVWRDDLGRHAALTRVAHPGPAPAAPAPVGARRGP